MPDKLPAHELGLWEGQATSRPRDSKGRFVRVRHGAEQRKILKTAIAIRAELGLPPLAVLNPKGS